LKISEIHVEGEVSGKYVAFLFKIEEEVSGGDS
jgi:hypothetical protein